MTRREFTIAITTLLKEMIEDGEKPFIDYCKRSDEEQKRLFDRGLSKCDGIIKISKHQTGKAIDIYLCHYNENNEIIVDYDWNKDKAEKWHKRGEELGLRELISFEYNGEIITDYPHFEGGL